MPGFDGTGPMGRGPMTGGGRGYCGVSVTDSRQPFGGRGRGRGWFGRGGGWRNRYWATGLPGRVRAGYTSDAHPQSSEVNLKEEMVNLRQEAGHLKSKLGDIQNRIDELDRIEHRATPDK